MRVYSNNYLAALSIAITNSATTMTVSTAAGLPSISGSKYFFLTIDGGYTKEVVKVTAVSSTTLTIVRAQEGTTAVSWAAGVVIELRFTQSSVIDWTDATANIVTTGSITGNQHISGYATTATAAAVTTLTVASARNQFFTGSTTQTVVLPVTSTLVVGQQYFIMNNSTGVVTVESSGLNSIQAIGAGSSCLVTCISTSGTGAASWSGLYTQVGGSGISGPGSSTANGIACWNGTGGSTLEDSSATIVSGVVTTVKDAIINTLTIGLGNQGTSTNTAIGHGALSADTSSSANNTCIGYQAGSNIGNATTCTAVGSGAKVGTTSAATNNTSLGYAAGANITTSGSVTCIGAGSGPSSTHSSITCVGYNCGNGAGAGDTMMGVNAGNGTSASGDYFGNQAGRYPTGDLNCAFGNGALIGASAGCSSGSCCAFGYNALGGASMVSGSQNCGFGYQAGVTITTGGNNTLLGYVAGTAGGSGAVGITTGTDNTCIGINSGVDTNSSVGCIAIGSAAVAAKATGSTSGTNGPGIAIGSASKLVGFRGDGSIYPNGSASAGFWRVKVNGTHYMIPLCTDGATAEVPTKGNGTESSNAVTATGNAGVITTSSLSTAGGSTYAITWTNTSITTTSVIVLTISGGTNTTQNITFKVVPGSGSATLTIYNNTASTALNGTILISYAVF